MLNGLGKGVTRSRLTRDKALLSGRRSLAHSRCRYCRG
jgi:hypothetical protein